MLEHKPSFKRINDNNSLSYFLTIFFNIKKFMTILNDVEKIGVFPYIHETVTVTVWDITSFR